MNWLNMALSDKVINRKLKGCLFCNYLHGLLKANGRGYLGDGNQLIPKKVDRWSKRTLVY